MTAVEDPAKRMTNFVVLPQLAKLAIACSDTRGISCKHASIGSEGQLFRGGQVRFVD